MVFWKFGAGSATGKFTQLSQKSVDTRFCGLFPENRSFPPFLKRGARESREFLGFLEARSSVRTRYEKARL
jgi:hypothetical protein